MSNDMSGDTKSPGAPVPAASPLTTPSSSATQTGFLSRLWTKLSTTVVGDVGAPPAVPQTDLESAFNRMRDDALKKAVDDAVSKPDADAALERAERLARLKELQPKPKKPKPWITVFLGFSLLGFVGMLASAPLGMCGVVPKARIEAQLVAERISFDVHGNGGDDTQPDGQEAAKAGDEASAETAPRERELLHVRDLPVRLLSVQAPATLVEGDEKFDPPLPEPPTAEQNLIARGEDGGAMTFSAASAGAARITLTAGKDARSLAVTVAPQNGTAPSTFYVEGSGTIDMTRGKNQARQRWDDGTRSFRLTSASPPPKDSKLARATLVGQLELVSSGEDRILMRNVRAKNVALFAQTPSVGEAPKQRSAVLSGTLLLTDLGNKKHELGKNDFLELKSDEGTIAELALTRKGLELSYVAHVESVTIGTLRFERDVTPRVLESLLAVSPLVPIWGSFVSLLGLVLGFLKFWRQGDS